MARDSSGVGYRHHVVRTGGRASTARKSTGVSLSADGKEAARSRLLQDEHPARGDVDRTGWGCEGPQGSLGKEDRDTKATLKKWTEDITAMKIKPLWRAHESKALVSKLRKGREKVVQLEDERRHRSHRRI